MANSPRISESMRRCRVVPMVSTISLTPYSMHCGLKCISNEEEVKLRLSSIRYPVENLCKSKIRALLHPRKELSRSLSRSRSRSRSRHRSRSRSRSVPRLRLRSRSRGRTETENPGNTLYVTGLSTRVTERELEAHFSKEGKVASCFLVVEPRTRVSRGFAFVTMDSYEDADRCIKYLNQSVLEGRYITVERSRRKRPRTPTPGHYLGLKSDKDHGGRDRDRDRSRHYRRDDYGHRRSPRRSPLRGRRDYSPPHRGERSRRDRSYSPYGSPDRRRYNHGSR